MIKHDQNKLSQQVLSNQLPLLALEQHSNLQALE